MDRTIKVIGCWAIFSGCLLFVGEFVRNWGDWQWWPFWLIDFITASLLVVGGYFALLTKPNQRLGPMTGAYGFASGVGYMSFFSHVNSINEPVSGTIIENGPLTVMIGSLSLVTTVLFLLCIYLSIRFYES